MTIQDRDRTGSREQLEGGDVKGVMLRNHLLYARENHPEAEVEAMIESLREGGTEIGGTILASSWYPFRTLIEVDRSIIERFGGGDIRYARHLGAFSAESALSSSFRIFRREDFQGFLDRSAPLHDQFQSFGTVTYERTGDASARLIHADYECFSPIYCESALGYFEKVATMHGIAEPVVSETSCQTDGDEACVLEIEW